MKDDSCYLKGSYLTAEFYGIKYRECEETVVTNLQVPIRVHRKLISLMNSIDENGRDYRIPENDKLILCRYLQ